MKKKENLYLLIGIIFIILCIIPAFFSPLKKGSFELYSLIPISIIGVYSLLNAYILANEEKITFLTRAILFLSPVVYGVLYVCTNMGSFGSFLFFLVLPIVLFLINKEEPERYLAWLIRLTIMVEGSLLLLYLNGIATLSEQGIFDWFIEFIFKFLNK